MQIYYNIVAFQKGFPCGGIDSDSGESPSNLTIEKDCQSIGSHPKKNGVNNVALR